MRRLFLTLVIFFLVACSQPSPLPSVTSTGVQLNAPTRLPPTVGPGTAAPTAGPRASPTPAPTPAPLELVVCQTGEPSSLYLYGDDVTARAGIFQALFDGPIDTTGYNYQPVILTALLSLEAGTAGKPSEGVASGGKGGVAATRPSAVLGPGGAPAQAADVA